MKRGGAGSVFILIILIVVLFVSLYFLYLNLPGKTQELVPTQSNSNERIGQSNLGNESSISKQFYDNMRFPDKEISYHISTECDTKRTEEAREAFSILEDRTILSFYSASESSAEINILCSDIAPKPEEEGHFIAGEGGPTEIINTSLYSVIFTGRMSLYRPDSCQTSHVALHELLHVLGFEHNNNENSILFPTLDCKQELDQYLVDELDRLYENPGLPDLKITEVDASKSGRYLNFEIKIVNQGLKEAGDSLLKVYADDEVIEFRDPETNQSVPYLDLSKIEVGTTKIFRVDNARLPGRNVDRIDFVVDEENKVEELFENNNRALFIVE